MFQSASGVLIQGGTFISQTNHTSKGMDILMEWVATDAFHNARELYDAPKCHPHTRVAVLDDIMKWVESESAQDEFMLWLFGPAGAGKSAIARRIAEMAAEMDMLIGTFFFSRTSPTRRSEDRLIATIVYQLTVSIPDTRSYVEDAIERDPAIFKKNVQTQIDKLLVKPFQSISPTQGFTKLIIIDGLDECDDSRAQVAILEAISHNFPQHNLPIKFLVVSRPELDIVTSFNCDEPLKSIHRRIALDDTYRPDDDIRLFFSDKFENIRLTHPLRSTIPIPWPTQEMIRKLVAKSSGQFIYASIVVKFVESKCHRPTTRLNIILGISPPGRTNPFAELDALYNHLLSSVDDIQTTLHVLSLFVMTPDLVWRFRLFDISPEWFLSLEQGDIQLALINLSSVITYDESSGSIKILHASLVDFLSDKHRSTVFYIDEARTCRDFVSRILQHVKGPDGIQAGDINLFAGLNDLFPWILTDELRTEILNFDLDALIKAWITRRYIMRHLSFSGCTTKTFWTWKRFLDDAGLEDRDKEEALNRLRESLELRIQIYQSDWRLQVLLTLVASNAEYWRDYGVPYCRCLDILLEMDDHHFHLVDRDALDLRHALTAPSPRLSDTLSGYVDGDAYALTALHCMRFISNPPKYSQENEGPEMGLIYSEWWATCSMTLDMLRRLLQYANTSPELVQFISNHDFHPAVQKRFQAKELWRANVHILAFLSRTNLCPNWMVISVIQRSRIINGQPSGFDKNDEIPDKPEDLGTTCLHTIQQRLDQCCRNADHGFD